MTEGNSEDSLLTPLSAESVDVVIKDCLAREDELIWREGVQQVEDLSAFVFVHGIYAAFALHKQRLELHRPIVSYWLSELSDTFKGNGWTFLKVPFLRDGARWGKEDDADVLMVLGMGLDLVLTLLPRELDSSLVGGVPYFKFVGIE